MRKIEQFKWIRADARRLLLVATACAGTASAQVPLRLDPVVVTATRTEARAFDLPVAIDTIDALLLQRNQLEVNLSESLSRVPGIVVANRWNYAQDPGVGAWLWRARQVFDGCCQLHGIHRFRHVHLKPRAQRGLPVRAVRDDLGQQRVVVAAHPLTHQQPGVHPQTRPGGRFA